MLSWSFIIVVLLLIGLAAFWQSGLSVRERANHAAQEACERMGVQFLDGTVAFAKLGFARNEAGRLSLRRTYVFDYTASSIERRQGFVVMLGQRLEHIGFERDTSHQEPVSRPVEQRRPSSSADGKVLDLEEWRRRRAQHADKTAAAPRHDQSDNGW